MTQRALAVFGGAVCIALLVGHLLRDTSGYMVHNPANPYWPILMKRVPQDSGDERLVPLAELLDDVNAAGLQLHRAFRSGFTPDFLPAPLEGLWNLVERVVEITPGLNVLAAHNVVVARKRQ